MSQVTEVICDQCGARKDKTNHWFRAFISQAEFAVYKDHPSSDTLKDFCGENCASKALEEWMYPVQEVGIIDQEEEILNGSDLGLD